MGLLQTKRRAFLTALAGVPGLRLLFPDGRAIAEEPSPSPSPGRDVIRELGVRSFINAAGTFTAMTGSLSALSSISAKPRPPRAISTAAACGSEYFDAK